MDGVVMYVHEIMSNSILKINSESFLESAVEMMLTNSRDEVVIAKDIDISKFNGNVEGIITKSDIGKLKRNRIDFKQPVGKYMTKDIIFTSPYELIKDARDLMIKNSIGRLLVVDKGQLVGIVTTQILLNSYYLKVEEMENQFSSILENLHEAVCVVNSKGIVTFWNKKSEKLYGIPQSEIVGKDINDFFTNALITRALKEKRPFENLVHEPKRNSNVVLSAIPIVYEGNLIGVVSTDRDIDEITKLSAELEREKSKVELLQEQMKTIIEDKYSFGSIIGKSKAYVDAMMLAKKIARTDASVLITGESGTGKEVFARAIHHESGRKGSFVPINCSAIPYNLLESELFGYVEGAFTGALKKGKSGKFELANGGTIFLDEIGDMPVEMQTKLLRVLQDGVINRIGSEKAIMVDVRIISATNKDLKLLMKEGKFREDLYYRLNVVHIYLPPLRERKEDIPDLVKTFVEEFSRKNAKGHIEITPEVMKILTNYRWNGNIRELRNTIERLVILSSDGKIGVNLLQDEIVNYINDNQDFEEENANDFDLQKNVANMEKNMIRNAMKEVGGNKAKAAELLNIKRSTLYYKLNQYNMQDLL